MRGSAVPAPQRFLRATHTSAAKQSAAVGTCGGRLSEARVTTWNGRAGILNPAAVEGRPPRASGQECPVARPRL